MRAASATSSTYTGVGAGTSAFVPSPSAPARFAPQHCTRPSDVNAQVLNSDNPTSSAGTHAPCAQFWLGVHAVLQLPQCARDTLRLVSQPFSGTPSQSPLAAPH